jgi:hypothetical protein
MKQYTLSLSLFVILLFVSLHYYSSSKEWKRKSSEYENSLKLERMMMKEKVIYVDKEIIVRDEKKKELLNSSDSCFDVELPCNIYNRLHTNSKSIRADCIVN